MRVPLALVFLGLSLLGSGCSLLCDSASLLLFKAREAAEDRCERRRDHRLAEEAWADVSWGQQHTADYACGFKDGFADYLYKGGNGEPPVLPPRAYRALRYQNVRGYQAIQDWFAGYRHGAAVAQQSGFRQLVVGPSSAPPPAGLPPAGPPPTAAHLLAPSAAALPGPPAPARSGNILPPPREAEPDVPPKREKDRGELPPALPVAPAPPLQGPGPAQAVPEQDRIPAGLGAPAMGPTEEPPLAAAANPLGPPEPEPAPPGRDEDAEAPAPVPPRADPGVVQAGGTQPAEDPVGPCGPTD